ncbi:MAG: single-stranded DNA-binding protein [Bifidobacteriaceae bacterium]|jgi:single-strand DNA-binding protein|nr:single-stranded DNA-binding protein [Bifidobacteriaceae bacterium]
MNNEITVNVEGWVAGPPRHYGKDDAHWAVFRMGSTAWWRDSEGGIRETPTSWFDVKVTQKGLLENVLISLRPGDPVLVSGRLAPHSWTDKDGKERVTLQITARAVGHNLRWGKAQFSRRNQDNRQRAAADGAGSPGVQAGTVAVSLPSDDAYLEAVAPGLSADDSPLVDQALAEEAFALADAALAAEPAPVG